MKFKINDDEWEIRQISNEEMMAMVEENKDFTHGVTVYSQQKIFLNKLAPNKKRTLYHELTHLFLYEYGHNQFDEQSYSYEDVCEISASSHDIIHKIAEDYFRKGQ